MDVTKSPYYRDLAKNLNSSGQRKLRRWLRGELKGIRQGLNGSLLEKFSGMKPSAFSFEDVQLTIVNALEERISVPFCQSIPCNTNRPLVLNLSDFTKGYIPRPLETIRLSLPEMRVPVSIDIGIKS